MFPIKKGPQGQGSEKIAVTGSLAEASAAVAILLSSLDVLLPYVSMRPNDMTTAENPLVEDSSHGAAACTVRNICRRLDHILSNRELWDCTRRHAMEQQALELLKAQTAEAQARTVLNAELIRPSYKMQPKLARLSTGMWKAYTVGKNPLFGIGTTPDAALRAFDLAYYKNNPNENQIQQ